MGSIPDWYPLVSAARWMGVAPWDLLRQPATWMEWALQAESAEARKPRAGCPLMG